MNKSTTEQNNWTVKRILNLYLEYIEQESDRSCAATKKRSQENIMWNFLGLFVKRGLNTEHMMSVYDELVLITLEEDIIQSISEEDMLEIFAYDYLYTILGNLEDCDSDSVEFFDKKNMEWCMENQAEKLIYELQFDITEHIPTTTQRMIIGSNTEYII